MKIMISGGAASGKSAHAERILCQHTAGGSRLYVAAMQPFGPAAEVRIARHRALRAGKGFETAERYTDLAHFTAPCYYDGILLECLSNLLANEMFSPEGVGVNGAADAILAGIDHLEKQCGLLVVVTNDIFSDGETYPSETMQYIRLLSQINGALAERADAVAESVCGILVLHKGEDLL
ncbi:bifunctional adenosylcobinamide kinase/adenosylcobinamide-phosphate guanylyltransferase [Intestinibacillus sp. Marseille-P6563]|uniref:bifunctional adenosylcobinamide kinase/adenosylcobinamide-phosphate guanylyltransferase n=1 Tax=Intestinibacillus sp. Marseille-P6563 TaxID=2364792 RepID=UPI000F04C945|nr:bifunctional adenosylcobinamide kinase/adenosylcobinamide-phosphate guanylyltransferase [Intestinibacillus sp. Marseille-P6563]